MNALTVYKASAGSGKTFTLATEYIKLLIENPQCYRNILAVTFTNKATEEMKMRILSQLYGIANGLDDSQAYLDMIGKLQEKEMEAKGMTPVRMEPREVRQRAAKALNLLLHQYSNFRVETIDSFFQRVLRNLARELDLTANLRIELNDNEVKDMAVDELIASLRMDDDLMRWILDYIQDSINDDKGWNVITPLKKFGRIIFDDFYKAESKQLTGVDFVEYIKDVRDEMQRARNFFQSVAASFFEALAVNGLDVSDFSNGASGVCGFFIKLRDMKDLPKAVGKRVEDAADNAEKWVAKSHPDRVRIMQLVNEELMPILTYGLSEFSKNYTNYQTAITTLRHINELRLLGSIERKVRELNEEAGRFLLSDTQQLLHSLISDSDSPFIFEKIGSILEHIMIDEFQDTSTVQWANFKVLLNECMSHENASNLIVGDVKQSIYRWRSGDWRMLNNIKVEFANPEMVDVIPLKTNYRSQGNVVEFNNRFFEIAARMEHDDVTEYNTEMAKQLETAYSDVKQKYKPQNKGNGEVVVEMLPKESDKEAMYDAIEGYIDSLITDGIPLNSIAILTRKNEHIRDIASHFATARPDFKIISDEAFRLETSVAVRIIMNALHLLTHPNETLTQATLVKLYHKGIANPDITENELLLTDGKLMDQLPAEYTANMDRLAAMPLFELVEALYRIFSLRSLEGESAYICAFYDKLTDYLNSGTGSIDGLIDEWNISLHKETISIGNQEGIRILSIHKSKGLEFDNVIIPFCDWANENFTDTQIWCKPNAAPYDRIPFISADYSGSLRDTIYADDFNMEKSQNVVDNLNLLYVAFTRAVSNLYILSKRGQSASRRAKLIEAVLPKMAETLDGATLDGEEDKEASLIFSFGSRYIAEEKKEKKTQNVLMQPSVPQVVTMDEYDTKVEFRQSNRSRDFISGDDDSEGNGYLKLGNILHNVFSKIRTSDDIDNALFSLEQEGLLYDETLSRKRIVEMLHKRLTHPKVAEWFARDNRIFNECSILSIDPESGRAIEQRPDRVIVHGDTTTVVDFKFGHPRDEYHDQVRNYMRLLQSMGHHDVKGYLWFVYSNKIEEVTIN